MGIGGSQSGSGEEGGNIRGWTRAGYDCIGEKEGREGGVALGERDEAGGGGVGRGGAGPEKGSFGKGGVRMVG